MMKQFIDTHSGNKEQNRKIYASQLETKPPTMFNGVLLFINKFKQTFFWGISNK